MADEVVARALRADKPEPFRFSRKALIATTERLDRIGVQNATLRDTGRIGLICRKQAGGRWHIAIEKKVKGRKRSASFGKLDPHIDISTIYEWFDRTLVDLAADTPAPPPAPQEPEDALPAAGMTLRDVLERHIRDAHVRDKTAGDYRLTIRRTFGDIDDPKMADLTAPEIREIYESLLATHSPATAHKSLRLIRTLWNTWAFLHPEGREPSGRNPVNRVTSRRGTVAPVAPRERALSPDLRPKWYAAATEAQAASVGAPADALLALFLTGMRLREITELRWTEIAEGFIDLPPERTKTHANHVRPVTPRLAAIFERREKLNPKECPWIFPMTRPGRDGQIGPLSHPRKALRLINEAASGDPDLISPHDLRRTYIGTADAGGIPRVATQLLVGHAVPGITDRYAIANLRHDLPRIAVEIEDLLIGGAA